MPQKQTSADDMKALIRALGSSANTETKFIIPEPTVRCACGKIVPLSQLEMLNTGVFLTHNDVCKGCAEGHKIDASHARIVCAKCKTLLTRVVPKTDKTGFKMLPGRTYHVNGCKFCNEKLTESPLIEKVIWNRQHGIKPQAPIQQHD